MAATNLSKEKLLKSGKSAKITSTRLGKLIKNGCIKKSAEDNFELTTFGVAQMQKDVLPKIRSKISG